MKQRTAFTYFKHLTAPYLQKASDGYTDTKIPKGIILMFQQYKKIKLDLIPNCICTHIYLHKKDE